MPKTIYLTESQLGALKLKPFIYKAIMGKHTSLGDNPALPSSGDFGFVYDLAKNRFDEVSNRFNDLLEVGVLESSEPDYLTSELSKKLSRCIEIETPIKNHLEELCERIVNEQFSIPEETILLECSLVHKISPKHAMRIMPEDSSNGGEGYSFEDVDEMDLSNKAILKRRVVNALIQGASMVYSVKSMIKDYGDEINKLSNELIPLWKEILIISDYLLFIKDEKITDKNPMQNSYVEVHIGKGDKKSSINSQGIIFPFLLKETFKGFFELFSSHGLPEDNDKAMYIINKADFLVAEPWDIRLGVPMWEIIYKQFKGTDLLKVNTIPYFFTDLCKLKTDDFNKVVKNLMASTKLGKRFIEDEASDIIHDIEYQRFKDRVQAKNDETGLIVDDCFTPDELDNVNVENDEEVLTEEDNNRYETYYRGICGEFDELKVKRQIWLADEPEYAAMYAEECGEDGHLYEIAVDMSRYKGYDWYYKMPDWWEPIDGVSENVQKELMNDGYNGYSFPLDSSEVLVLFDKSLIVGVKEIPLEDYLDDRTITSESKKSAKPILIDENMEAEMQGYHGSGADFNKFWHKKYLNTGAGSQTFGWGTYITNDEAVARGYSDNAKKVNGSKEEEIKKVLMQKYGYDEAEAENEAYDIACNFRWAGSLSEFINLCKNSIYCDWETPERKEMNARWLDVLTSIPSSDAFLYEVDVPDDNGENYIEWYEQFPSHFMKRIIEGFLRLPNNKLNAMATNNYPFRCDLYKDIQWMKENPDNAHKMIDIISNGDYEDFFSSSYYTNKALTDGKSVYRRLQNLMGSDKAASLFLMQCGFDGIKYPSGTKWNKPDGSSEDAYNYVIFDANKVKIINKETV